MTFVRNERSGAEVCVKCGVENEGKLTWKRSRTALGDRPLLCANCAKALSIELKKFVANWIKKGK